MQSDQKKLENAIKDVLKTALVHDGLARGLKEAVKALDRCSMSLHYQCYLYIVQEAGHVVLIS